MNQARFHFSHRQWAQVKTGAVGVWARGWVTDGEQHLDSEGIALRLCGWVSAGGARRLERVASGIGTWSGNFAFAIGTGDGKVILGVDIIRSIPLLYSRAAGSLVVSDSYDWLLEATGYPALDVDCAEELLVSGFVWGNASLHAGIHALQAGEVALLDGGQCGSCRHFSFDCEGNGSAGLALEGQAIESLDRLLSASIQRMLNSAGDVGRWIVPLSGGFDSRTIVSYLYRLGVKNVLCFSYGRAGNEESTISKRVADALGYRWHFVEYNATGLAALMAEKTTREYLRYACNGTSLPHLQDYFALKELRANGILREGDILVPGHALDFIAGSHVQADLVGAGVLSEGAVSGRLLRRHGWFWWDERGQEAVRKRIESQIKEKNNGGHRLSAAGLMEWFDWQERQAKFIVNSVRAYDFFGFRWRTPLWDRDLVEWWRGVPYALRLDRKLFRAAFREVLGARELSSIPLHKAAPEVVGITSSRHPLQATYSWIRRTIASQAGRCRLARVMSRIRNHYVPPRAAESALGLEELFGRGNATVAAWLGVAPAEVEWPASLRRHFKWRESWLGRDAGCNQLLAAVTIRDYLAPGRG